MSRNTNNRLGYRTVQIDYDGNCENLVKYIQKNYRESELIDFEGERRRQDLNLILEQDGALKDQLLAEDRIRHWNFIAKKLVLRKSIVPNRHQ